MFSEFSRKLSSVVTRPFVSTVFECRRSCDVFTFVFAGTRVGSYNFPFLFQLSLFFVLLGLVNIPKDRWQNSGLHKFCTQYLPNRPIDRSSLSKVRRLARPELTYFVTVHISLASQNTSSNPETHAFCRRSPK